MKIKSLFALLLALLAALIPYCRYLKGNIFYAIDLAKNFIIFAVNPLGALRFKYLRFTQLFKIHLGKFTMDKLPCLLRG